MIRHPSHTQAAARHARRAFTLLEVLVVVAIIVMLAGIGGYLIIQRYQDAQIQTARAKARDLATKVELYYVNNGNQYPANLEVLTQAQPGGLSPLCTPEAIMDPWGREFQLDVKTDGSGNERVIIFTQGPRGQITNLDR
jgi:general secretion pathway protein G